MLEDNVVTTGGASIQAIQQHYDLSNEFYQLWLDKTMTYSCALWQSNDSLEQAQLRKIDYHLEQSRSKNVHRLLDIGCGWGSLLVRAVEDYGVRNAVGLTLSNAQLKYIKKIGKERIYPYLDSWESHKPESSYDSIVSIGALEHFVRPEYSKDERISHYQKFFNQCHRWLKPSRNMSLQTMTYGIGEYKKGSVADIFPESNLPRLEELITASRQTFEIIRLKNHRLDYAKTCQEWLKRLKSKRELALKIVGEKALHNYEKFLFGGACAYIQRVFYLYRITLQRIN